MERIFTLQEIDEVAQEVLKIIQAENKNVVAFYGEMGAGKTTLIKSIAKQLGAIDIIQSPTFAIINEYALKNGSSIYHFDFYRIERIEEALDLGLDEYFYSGKLCFIEWPEIVETLLPEDTIKFRLSILDHLKRKLLLL